MDVNHFLQKFNVERQGEYTMASEMLDQVLQAEQAATQQLQDAQARAKEMLQQAHKEAETLQEEKRKQAQAQADQMLADVQKQAENDLAQGALDAKASGKALRQQAETQQAAAVSAIVAHVIG